MPYKNVPENLWGKMDSCVEKVMKEDGVSKDRAIAICHESVVKEQEHEVQSDETNEEKSYDAVPMMGAGLYFGATSYAELAEMNVATQKANEINELIHQFPHLASNIMDNPTVEDKQSAIRNLADELGQLIKSAPSEKGIFGRAIDALKEMMDTKAKKSETDGEHPASHYLVVEDKEKPTTWHLRVRNASGDLDHRLMGAAWAALHGGYRGNKYAGPNKEIALKKLKALYSREKMDTPTEKAISGVELLVFKDTADTWRWAARYSNKYRDRDDPPEIIADRSHRRFVERVDKGLTPYPELWLWHVPQWKIGQADWIAYDDIGFAVASGYFHKGCESVAEWLSKQQDWKVSHGMPPNSLKRDENDPTIIVEHDTREISFLPGAAAANELTGFVSLHKEAVMAIPDAKKKTLVEHLGMSPELLERLEKMNAKDATTAEDKGIESKEVTEEETLPVVDEQKEEPQTEDAPEASAEAVVEEEPQAEAEQKESDPEPEAEKSAEGDDPLDQYPTRKEVVEAVSAVITPLIKEQETTIAEQADTIKELRAELAELRKSREDSVKETINNTPLASLMSSMLDRATGNPAAEVKESDELAQDKPKEKKAGDEGSFPVPFLNRITTSGE